MGQNKQKIDKIIGGQKVNGNRTGELAVQVLVHKHMFVRVDLALKASAGSNKSSRGVYVGLVSF